MGRDYSPSSVAQLAHSKQTVHLLSFEHVCSGGSWAFCPRVSTKEPELNRSGAEHSVTAGPLRGPPQWCMQLSLSQACSNGLFPTPAPMFIYPQAWDGQTRWEPDNSNRNNSKGEQDISLGSPSLPALTHTHTHVNGGRAQCAFDILGLTFSHIILMSCYKYLFCCCDHCQESSCMKWRTLGHESVIWGIVAVFCMSKNLFFFRIYETLVVVGFS